MSIDKIYHEMVMVKGGLDALANLMAETEDKEVTKCCWVLMEVLADKMKNPLDEIEQMMHQANLKK